MIKSIKTIMRQDREPYRIPRRVQDVIPIQCVWPDGIFKVGIKFSKTYRFTDRKSTRLNSSHRHTSRMPSSA